MADTTPAPASGTNAVVGKTDGNPGTPINAPEVVTRDVFEATTKQLFAMLRKLEPKAPEPPPEERVTVAALRRELDIEKAARVKAQTDATAKLARSNYKDELVKRGVNPVHADDLARSWVSQNQEKLRVGENDTVHVEDEIGIKGVQELVNAWMGTDHGKSYLPPPSTAGAPRGGKISTSGPVTEQDVANMTPEQLTAWSAQAFKT